MSIQFDNKISLGHLISVGTILFACVMAYASMSARQEQAIADLVAIKAENQGRENRVRAVEIAQASQSSDLRAIQTGIGRIEVQLQKLGEAK